jgi:hypothetical protein
MSSSPLIDLWSVVSGLSMGAMFMYLLFNDGVTLNVNVKHHYVIEEHRDDVIEEEVVELEVPENEVLEEDAQDDVESVELEDEDNEVLENEKDD